jgi:hypothetical protein
MLWLWIFDQEPPRATRSLGELVGLLVSIVSFSIAGLGLLAYTVIRDRLSTQMSEEAKRLLAATAEQDDVLSKEIIAEVRPPLDFALVKLAMLNSVQYERQYEQIWEEEGYSPDWPTAGTRGLVEATLREIELVGREADALPDGAPYDEAKNVYKNNLAYQLGTLRRPEDAQRALTLAGELQGDSDYRVRETASWVFLRFSKPGQSEWARGEVVARSLFEDERIPAEWRDKKREKYTRVFPDLSVDAGASTPEGA